VLIGGALHAKSACAATPNPAPDPQSIVDISLLLRQADQARQHNQCTTAIALYTQVEADAPGIVSAHRSRASCLEATGDYAAAAEDYRALLERYPNDSFALGALGWELLLQGHILEARRITKQALQLDPVSTWGVNLAETELLLGNLPAARKRYLDALRLIPDDQTFRDGPLDDLNSFIKRGWSVDDVTTMRRWLEMEYPKFQRYREAWAEQRQAQDLVAKLQYAKAEHKYQDALRRFQALFGLKDVVTSSALINLATHYRTMGLYAKANPLFQRALQIRLQVLGAQAVYTAQSLNDLAVSYDDTSDFMKAEPLFLRALDIFERVNGLNHPDTAPTLNNLAQMYLHVGSLSKAEILYRRSLDIRMAALGPEDPGTAAALNNLASLYVEMGAYARAEPLYQQALAIREKSLGAEHPATAAALSNLAGLYAHMGAYVRAQPLSERALAIREKVFGAESPKTADSLNELASLDEQMSQYEQALTLFQRANRIFEGVYGADDPATARGYNNLGAVYHDLGEFAQAIELEKRALAIREKVLGANNSETILSLNNLAALYVEAGEREKAQPLYQRALALALASQAKPLMATILYNLGNLYAAEGNAELAIFWGKQAVNSLQRQRVGFEAMDRSLQRSFLESNRTPYERLAQRLIDAGRLPEAQQALQMLKDQEYHDFIRAAETAEEGPIGVDLSDNERSWQRQYQAIADRLVALGEEAQKLRRVAEPDAVERARLLQIEQSERVASAAFNDALADIRRSSAMLTAGHLRQIESRNLDTSRLGMVADLDQGAGGGVVLLQYIVLDDSIRVLLTTGSVEKAFTLNVGARQLNGMVEELLLALRDPKSDPRAASMRLRELLISPLNEDLRQAGARALMLSLDGTLRYVPFAALFDGQQYLVEQYALSIFDEAAPGRITRARQPGWRAAGLGLTQGRAGGFSPLPAVRQELEGIVRQSGHAGGVLDGEIRLDGDFTRAALIDAISAGYPVLHLASHFQFSPTGGESNSFLLLGDGTELTLADLRQMRLPNVDLLTLSACDTAVGSFSDAGADGHEVEGMATEAQRLGASSVLASLWSVADSSTAQIMEEFYRGHEQQSLNKAEALRAAQLRLLHGESVADSAARANRGAVALGASQPERASMASPESPFAHPYFWAPFILMGNWQ
jgi:CHAT domain-containing protein/Tfp pilus assembly protein PilF